MYASRGFAFCILVLLPDPAFGGDVTPEKLKSALAQLEKLAEDKLETTGVPGMAIVVVHDDRIVYAKGFGVREVGKADRVDANTVFQLASVSKPITSTILAILVALGIIDWDDPVTDLDPDFRLHDPLASRAVTLRDLLCHRSGLGDHEGDLLEDLGYDRAAVLHRLRFAKPASSFRSKYAYTNFGITEAAVAAARPTRKSWEDLADELLYQPLGMKSTSSRFRDYAEAKNRAVLHVPVDGKWVAKYVRQPDAQSPGGGVSSTANDLGQWLRLQLANGKHDGKQLIKTSALSETHRPQIVSSPPKDPSKDRATFYGLCWNVNYDEQGRVRLGHSGAFGMGAATVVSLLPSENLGIAILTNGEPRGLPEALAATFQDLALHGKAQRDYFTPYEAAFRKIMAPSPVTTMDTSKPPKQALPPLELSAYAGTYQNDYYGPLEVAVESNNLVLRLGPNKTPYPARHWSRDTFTYQPTGESAAGASAVTFTIDASQRADNVRVQNLDGNGQGTFVVTREKSH